MAQMGHSMPEREKSSEQPRIHASKLVEECPSSTYALARSQYRFNCLLENRSYLSQAVEPLPQSLLAHVFFVKLLHVPYLPLNHARSIFLSNSLRVL
jgi:hypothetical protein